MSVNNESQQASDLQAGVSEQIQAQVPSKDAPFNALPAELFVKTLVHVFWLIRKTKILWDSDWTVPYQLVCRRWRDIICSTPQLWQEIWVCSSPEWLDFCLKRCAGAPATVFVFRPVWADKTFATLRHHASSIRECHIHSLAVVLEIGFPSLLATQMPALEVLSIDVVVHYGDDPTDILITHDLFPRLTTLDLRNCKPPLDTAVYASLRNLKLVSCWWEGSYGEFLGILSKCHNLVFMSLDEDMLNSLIDSGSDDSEMEEPIMDQPAPTLPVVLPSLGGMQLLGPPKALLPFVANIHAPQATRLELVNCLDDESDPLLTRILAPNPQKGYPFLSSPHTIFLSCWDEAPFKLSVRSGPSGRNVLLSILYGRPDEKLRPENENLHPNLIAIMDTFSVAAVDTLEIEGYLDQVEAGTWQRVFRTFANMRTLRLKGKGTLDSVWLGLSQATALRGHSCGT